VRRRGALASLLVALAAPAFGQPRVAFLSVGLGVDSPAFDILRDEWRSLGQVEGAGYRLDVVVAERPAELDAAAQAIVRAQPRVLMALNSSAAVALRAATTSIPIVVVSSGDPIALGLTRSQSRPSGNVTGIEDGTSLLAAKRLELLAELLPRARRIGLLYDPENVNHRAILDASRTAAAALGLELLPVGIVTAGEVALGPDRAKAAAADALVVAGGPLIIEHRRTLIDRALALGLPSIHAFGFEAQDGALAAYGTDTSDNWRRAAQYVDRLLRGAAVAELPFEPPGRVFLTLNLRTARALGLAVPPSVLARADEVIE
jgi:putative tryptophan/tyrosine transport system substrate-binding protein